MFPGVAQVEVGCAGRDWSEVRCGWCWRGNGKLGDRKSNLVFGKYCEWFSNDNFLFDE